MAPPKKSDLCEHSPKCLDIKCSSCGPRPVCAFGEAPSTGERGRKYRCRKCERERINQLRRERVARHYAPVKFEITVDETDVAEHATATSADIPALAVEMASGVPEKPTLTPLQQAYLEREDSQERREMKAKLKALMDENDQLRDTISEMVRLCQPPDIIIYEKAEWDRVDAVACGVASDWHVEEPVIKETVHGLNEFNLDIAKERAMYFFKHLLKLTDMLARDCIVRTIFLSVLGDFFSGWIHKELMANCLLAPGDAARYWQSLFISGLDFLLRESEYNIEMDCIPGNHGRLTEKMHFSDVSGTSLETFAYHHIAGRYTDNPRVRVNVAHQPMLYRRFFEKFIMRQIHGWETKYNGGVGGLTIPLNKAIAQWDKGIKADFTVLGHYHTLFDGSSFLVNGSLIGYNLFAQGIKASPEEARQAFFPIYARNGGSRSGYHEIWLNDNHKMKEAA